MDDDDLPYIVYNLRPFTCYGPQVRYYKNGTGMTLTKTMRGIPAQQITLSRMDMVSLLNILYENIIMRPSRENIDYDKSIFEFDAGVKEPEE